MAIYKLDKDGNPIKAGSKKKAVVEDGKFHFRYQIRKSSKHPKNMKRHFWATEEDMPRIVKSFETGKPIEAAKGLKWKDAFKYWCDGKPLFSPDHIRTIERNIGYLCEFHNNENLTIEETTKTMFRLWINHRAKKSVVTANRSRDIITVARYAYRDLDLLSEEPECLSVKKFAEPKTNRKAMPIEYVKKYLDATEEHYGLGLSFIIEFVFFTGVRSTEACQLTEDRAGDTITILQKAKGAGKREADIIEDEYIRDILNRAKKYKKTFRKNCEQQITEAREKLEIYKNDTRRTQRCYTKIDKLTRHINAASREHVFINNDGTPWNKDTLRRAWKKCCEEAGLEYFVPHELRHTFATLAGSAGFSERFIQAAMRWDDPRQAQTYVHETKNMAEEVSVSVRNTIAEQLGKKKPASPPTIKTKNITEPIEVICPCCNKPIILTPEKPKDAE